MITFAAHGSAPIVFRIACLVIAACAGGRGALGQCSLAELWVPGACSSDFGHSVAIDGGVAFVGARVESEVAIEGGAAYVLTLEENGWQVTARLQAPGVGKYNLFGFAVDVCGDVIVVSAPGEHHDAEFAGSVYVFRRDGDMWVQEAQLRAPDPADYDYFGTAVAIDGNVLVIGVFTDDDLGRDSGSAYVFHRASVGGRLKVRLKNWITGAWDEIRNVVTTTSDRFLVDTECVAIPGYVRVEDGRIEVSLRLVAEEAFDGYFDQVSLSLR